VDGDTKENSNPKQKLDDGEFVQVLIVSITNLLDFLQEQSKTCNIDAKVYGYALGLGYFHKTESKKKQKK